MGVPQNRWFIHVYKGQSHLEVDDLGVPEVARWFFFKGKSHENIWLVVSNHLKNMKVSWDDYSQYMGK